MEDRLRAINIASVNPDSTKVEQTQWGIITNLTRNITKIEAIQETHIAQGIKYTMEKYRAITVAAVKKDTDAIAQGGVAIAIHESAKPYITHIKDKEEESDE